MGPTRVGAEVLGERKRTVNGERRVTYRSRLQHSESGQRGTSNRWCQGKRSHLDQVYVRMRYIRPIS